MPFRSALLLTLFASIPIAAGQERLLDRDAPMQVMTDTIEYCDRLAVTVAEMRRHQPVPRPEIDALAAEGRSLCHTGHVRPGVQRLRAAWRRLRE